MKTLIATVALTVLGAAAASAATLSGIDAEAIRLLAPALDLNALSAEQVRALSDFVAQDDHAARTGAAEFIQSIVRM